MRRFRYIHHGQGVQVPVLEMRLFLTLPQGFLAVPDNVSQMVDDGAMSAHSTSKLVLDHYGPRSFRGALLMALAISPLLMLTTRDLLGESPCEEQILLVVQSPFHLSITALLLNLIS
jgi:hypothetical protein